MPAKPRPRPNILVWTGSTILAITTVGAIYEWGFGGTLPASVLNVGMGSLFIMAMVGILLEGALNRRRLREAQEDPKEQLRRRIKAVNTAFAEASTLMADLQRDLEAQQAAREALIGQAEKQQRLLEINQDQAERIRTILVGETKATIRAERRQQWMFFGLGVLVSIPIGVAINLLVP